MPSLRGTHPPSYPPNRILAAGRISPAASPAPPSHQPTTAALLAQKRSAPAPILTTTSQAPSAAATRIAAAAAATPNHTPRRRIRVCTVPHPRPRTPPSSPLHHQHVVGSSPYAYPTTPSTPARIVEHAPARTAEYSSARKIADYYAPPGPARSAAAAHRRMPSVGGQTGLMRLRTASCATAVKSAGVDGTLVKSGIVTPTRQRAVTFTPLRVNPLFQPERRYYTSAAAKDAKDAGWWRGGIKRKVGEEEDDNDDIFGGVRSAKRVKMKALDFAGAVSASEYGGYGFGGEDDEGEGEDENGNDEDDYEDDEDDYNDNDEGNHIENDHIHNDDTRPRDGRMRTVSEAAVFPTAYFFQGLGKAVEELMPFMGVGRRRVEETEAGAVSRAERKGDGNGGELVEKEEW